MATTLITGASGFVGKAFAASLQGQRDIVTISRKDPGLDAPWVRGAFNRFEDLRGLDAYEIDSVVHFAAVTGGCFEQDGMEINAEGTRRLLRYLIDRGCKRFVLASSVAVVGTQSLDFRPVQLPMPDEHPCLDRHGYGFSKYMMEEVTRYLARQNPEISIINLRLCSVFPDDLAYDPVPIKDPHPWCTNGFCAVCLSDAVRAFTLALDATPEPGVHIYNVGPQCSWAQAPVAQILRGWWGDEVDLSFYEQPGQEYGPVWDVTCIEQDLGFRAEMTAARMPKR